MPAVKSAGAQPAAKKSAAKTTEGVTLNKDGSPRKKRGTAAPKEKKKFLLYSVAGNELSFAVEYPGATGQIAVASAVRDGVLSPDTPYVFITPGTIGRAVEVEAVERAVQYKVKAGSAKPARRGRKAAAAVPAAASSKQDALPPSPEATTENPFA